MEKIRISVKKLLDKAEITSKIMSSFSFPDFANKKILIICEDFTRSSPVNVFFKEFVDKVPTSADITVLFALGTHRPMTKEEMLEKLGIDEKDIARLTLTNHNASDNSKLTFITKLDGVDLKINSLVSNCDIVITIGGVLPHRIVGFSGGGKMFCPGIGNIEMIDHSHWISNRYPEEEIMAKIDNPMRKFIDQIATSVIEKFSDKKFIAVNFVSTPEGVVDVFVGNFFDSYHSAINLCLNTFVKKVKPVNSILAIVDDKCVDFWQAAKAVYNCARILNDNGKIVVHGLLKEGISASHGKDIAKFGYSTIDRVRSQFDSGEMTNQVASSHMIRVSEHLQRINIFLSSPNISPQTCKDVNLGYFDPKLIDENDFDYVVYNPVDIVLDKN